MDGEETIYWIVFLDEEKRVVWPRVNFYIFAINIHCYPAFAEKLVLEGDLLHHVQCHLYFIFCQQK
jgi:hypothetical protein